MAGGSRKFTLIVVSRCLRLGHQHRVIELVLDDLYPWTHSAKSENHILARSASHAVHLEVELAGQIFGGICKQIFEHIRFCIVIPSSCCAFIHVSPSTLSSHFLFSSRCILSSSGVSIFPIGILKRSRWSGIPALYSSCGILLNFITCRGGCVRSVVGRSFFHFEMPLNSFGSATPSNHNFPTACERLVFVGSRS
jgi:hypothetical protein